MRSINLRNHIQALQVLDDAGMTVYAKAEAAEAGKVTKTQEEQDLSAFTERLSAFLEEGERYSATDCFFLGYCIPRIGKEFDLLRFCEHICINIELKNRSTEETVLRQLLRNRYYLRALDRTLYLFTYIATEDRLYSLKNDMLTEGSWEELADLLRLPPEKEVEDPDLLFRPARYLISPVYTPHRFLSGEYFLTGHQEAIRTEILQSDDRLIGIEGRSGTGKTLLLYDLYRQWIRSGTVSKREAAIVQCGGMHYGHEILLRNGIRIVPFELAGSLPDDPAIKILLFDEIQYLDREQMQKLLAHIARTGIRAVFAWDPLWAGCDPEAGKTVEMLREQESLVRYKLTAKIRTNSDTAVFTECLFDLTRHKAPLIYDHVRVIYTDSETDSGKVTDMYRGKGYLRVTSDDGYLQNFLEEEPDSAVFVLDENFFYDELGHLSAKDGSRSVQTLQRRISRVRRRMCVIVQNNPEVFKVLVSLFA